jgi:glycine dehydrogenase
MHTPLSDLFGEDEFLRRHIGPTSAQQQEMAQAIGYDSVDALIDATIPAGIRRAEPLQLPGPRREVDVLTRLRDMASRNQLRRSHIGMGYYGTYTPAVIQRNVLENPGWYTAYTPYQAEISQGRLEALLTYQQMVMDLTGMELANASMLDEATAAAEAMTLLQRVNRQSKSNVFLVDADCHPQTLAVLETRARPLGIEVHVGNAAELIAAEDAFGLLLSYPGSSGAVQDIEPLISAAHATHTLVAVATDLLALTLLRSPGAAGADVVVGSSQRFGIPMGYGGPHAAFFATRDAYKRSTPGRIIGVSKDRHGHPALRMALQTREQHIRREKATSNICTAQALLAVMAAFYAMYHGPDGLRRIAERTHRLTQLLAAGLKEAGLELRSATVFDTLTVEVGTEREAILARAASAGINLRTDRPDTLGISLDETCGPGDVNALLEVFTGVPGAAVDAGSEVEPAVPGTLHRDVDYLQHPLFNEYHSETEMLRYLRRLEGRDIALNRAMIPLGSCTMKLNATTEMLPVSWPEFAALHPFAPAEQAQGYRELLDDLERMLAECTGYDAVSMQPNAGSQGEYAGLLAIKRYHESRGDTARAMYASSPPRPTAPTPPAPYSPECAWSSSTATTTATWTSRTCAARRRSTRHAGRHHDYLPLDARRIRGGRRRGLRRGARARRPGLRGWRQPECPGRPRRAGAFRCRRIAPQPAQDLLHPPRRWRPGYGPHRRARAPAAVPALAPGGTGTGTGGRQRRRLRHALRQRLDPADFLDLHRPHGRHGADGGQQGRHPVGELHRPAPARSLPGPVHGTQRHRCARVHHRHPSDPREQRHR